MNAASTRRLPDFVIIGAPKCGTTSLARWLGAHPDGFVPPAKELRFLDTGWDRGLDWYMHQLAPQRPATIVGEATPTYLAHPEAPARAASVLPTTRFLALLREPVDRLWSHYWFSRRGRRDTPTAADLERLLIDEQQHALPADGLFTHGLYAHHLERWAEHVGRDRLMALTVDDLQANPVEAFARVCRFVGLDPDAAPPEVGTVHNAHHRIRSTRLRNFMLQHHVWRRWPRVGFLVDRLNSASVRYPELDPDVHDRLARWYALDTARLSPWVDIPASWPADRGRDPTR